MSPVYNSKEDVQELIKGEQQAYIRLYKKFEPKLYAFAFKLIRNKDDAEDVVQEVFLKVWEKKHHLNPDLNFDSYLFTIARNRVFNIAKHRAYEFAFQYYLVGETFSENSTENEINYQELSGFINEVYNNLPPVRKQVFTLSRIEGLSNSEIAQQLNTSNSNIENHINKVIRKIKKTFELYKIIYILAAWYLK